MKMLLSYAEGFLTKGYAGPYRTLSCHDDLLVIEDLEDYVGRSFLGTRLSHGKLQADTSGYVVFHRVTPVVDENTKFKL